MHVGQTAESPCRINTMNNKRIHLYRQTIPNIAHTMLGYLCFFLLALTLVLTSKPVFATSIRDYIAPLLSPHHPVHNKKNSPPGHSHKPNTGRQHHITHHSHAKLHHHEKKHLWNLQDADIHSVIDLVAKLTGKNFIVDPRVQGKITITSAKPIANKQIYPLFLSILDVLGYRAISTEKDVVKIVPADSARFSSLPIIKQAGNQPSAQTIVKVIQLKYISARSIIPTLTPLLPSTASITAYLPTNVLILAGKAANIEKISNIIHIVDNSNAEGIAIIQLRHAIASQVVSTLNALAKQFTDRHVALAALTRSNSILISGNRKQRLRYRLLIQQLDQADNQRSGNTRVVYLHYRKAKALVPILLSIAKADYGSAVGTNRLPENSKDKKIQPTFSTPATGNKVVVNIAADPDINAIIITAPPALRRVLRNTISQLDIRPAQVLVQALIVEVTEQTLKQLGIQWGTRHHGNITDGTPFSTLDGGLGIGFIHSSNLRVLITALQKDTNTNILSTPTLVVMDNQKASIKVGTMQPFTQASYQTNSTTPITNPYTSISRQFVGLHLDVTPQINQGNAVELKIDQGNESILSDVKSNAGDPVTSQSTIKTSVLVNNGEILVLGGLMKNEHDRIQQKVPFFGNIPIIGHLFTNSDNTIEKKNLLVFLRPVIIHTNRLATIISQGKYQFMRNEQIIDHASHDALLAPWKMKQQLHLPNPFNE